jgi:hypothetical protein
MRLRASLAPVVALVLVTVAPEANGGGGVAITACGQVVAANAVLTQDLVCTGDGIVVGASGITIDLKGFTIRGDRDVGDYGIDDSAGYDNITIKNGLVRNFYLGVDAEGAADSVSVSAWSRLATAATASSLTATRPRFNHRPRRETPPRASSPAATSPRLNRRPRPGTAPTA